MSARLVVAMVMWGASSISISAEVGRFFFTPAQRATLDAARKQNLRVEIGIEENERAPSTPAAAPVPQSVRFNGLIQRSDGKNTVWLNNKPVTNQTATGLNVSTNRNDTRIKLTTPDGGRSLDLKVGQTAEMTSGTVEENYRRRTPPPLKPEEKPPLPGAGNDGSSVQKRTSESAPDSIESSPRIQRKPRTASRDAQDEAPAGGTDNR